jgi:hypothetical protein
MQPPSGWLLHFYGASQQQLQKFTDLQLASMAASLDRLLLQQRQQQRGQDKQQADNSRLQQQQLEPWQQLYAGAAVPPAVWQLQLELDLRSRYRNSSSSRSSKKPDASLQQHQQHRQQQRNLEVPGDADDAETGQLAQAEGQQQQQQQQGYQPLWVVGGVLRHWRSASANDSWLMSSSDDSAPAGYTAQARTLSAV